MEKVNKIPLASETWALNKTVDTKYLMYLVQEEKQSNRARWDCNQDAVNLRFGDQ